MSFPLVAAHENTGERSSQYAAENSCRARYGPYTEWMASFDTGVLEFTRSVHHVMSSSLSLGSISHVVF
jgi:hypothetical protein